MRVCVFCGSSAGSDPSYLAAATALGTVLGQAGVDVVYGGNAVGLMGAVADAAMAGGSAVTGVVPTGVFSREMPHPGLTELVEVGSMHERKLRMYDLADAFVGLPGGLGTLEELAEIATWSQLGLHAKPIVVVDIGGFWAPLLGWLDAAVEAGFVKPANRSIISSVATVGEVLPAIEVYSRMVGAESVPNRRQARRAAPAPSSSEFPGLDRSQT